MAKKMRRYWAEYRERLIELVRGRWTAESLSRKFKPSGATIRSRVAEADRS